jgi:hypothetical protein
MLLGLCGLMGSGKSTVASYLVSEYHFIELSFAGLLKDVVSLLFDWPRDVLEGDTPESREWRNTVDEWWSQRLSIDHLTPRMMLQRFGTDLVRQKFHPDFWVIALERKIVRLMKTHTNIVISDCRFENEVDLLHQLGGLVVRVERETPEWSNLASIACFSNNPEEVHNAQQSLHHRNIHESEWRCVSLLTDLSLYNEGTKEDLHHNVDRFMHCHQELNIVHDK